MIKKYIIVILCLLGLSCVIADKYYSSEPVMYDSGIEFTEEKVEIIMREFLVSLDLEKPPQYPKALLEYYKYYEIHYPEMEHYFGTFESSGRKLAAHVYLPRQAGPGTVFMVHGYLDHSGTFNWLMKHLAANGYGMVVLDLPGHGFSEGERGYIKRFSEYGDALRDLIDIVASRVPRPWFVVGHSTGCSAVIELMRLDKDYPFKSTIFCAPLVRSHLYDLTKLGMFLAGWFIPRVGTSSGNSSSNPDYIDFMDNKDPLMVEKVPMAWVWAMIFWNGEIEELVFDIKKIIIIQGTKDKVVDWRHNLEYIKNNFPDSRINFIKNGFHKLLNEPEPIRRQVMALILDGLKED